MIYHIYVYAVIIGLLNNYTEKFFAVNRKGKIVFLLK